MNVRGIGAFCLLFCYCLLVVGFSSAYAKQYNGGKVCVIHAPGGAFGGCTCGTGSGPACQGTFTVVAAISSCNDAPSGTCSDGQVPESYTQSCGFSAFGVACSFTNPGTGITVNWTCAPGPKIFSPVKVPQC